MDSATHSIPARILIVRLSSIGDILLSFPLVQAIANSYPEAKIDFLTGKAHTELLQPIASRLDKILRFDKTHDRRERGRIRAILRKSDYDFILDIHNNHRSRSMLAGLGISVHRLQKYRVRRFLYTKCRWKSVYPHIHVAQKYLNTFPIALDNPDLYVKIDYGLPELTENIDNFLADFPPKKPKIILFPGARHFTKRWPLEYYAELIAVILDQTDWQVIIGGDTEDGQYVSQLKVLENQRVHNACGQFDLLEIMLLIRICDWVVSNDSAPMHMAALFHKKQIAIFGNTVPRFGFAPLNPKAVILENRQLRCRPCSHIGYKKCPKGHFRCLRDISVESVMKKLELSDPSTP